MRWLAIIFWICVFFVFYANCGYLLLLQCLSIVRGKRMPVPEMNDLPSVSLIIAAHNEEKVIADKIENSLVLDYPRDRLEIIVVSDGSTDGTNKIVRSYSKKGVVLKPFDGRRGKVAAVNDTVPTAQGAILVFSDADSAYQPDAIRKLVRHFADERVGAVSGEEKRIKDAASGKGLGESLYARLDNRLKRLEGEIGSQVMVNGGFYAIRKELYPFIPEDLTHDAIVPCHLILQGYRMAYEPEALSTEVYPLTTAEDFRRRLRTIGRAFSSYLSVPQALNPFRTGLFAFQVLSHRFSRWFVAPFLGLAIVSNILLVSTSAFYRGALFLQVAFYLLASLGFLLDIFWQKRPTLFYIPYYFTYIFTAAFLAVILAMAGRRVASWEPTRRMA